MNSKNHSKTISLKNNKSFCFAVITPVIIAIVSVVTTMLICNHQAAKAETIDSKANSIQEQTELKNSYSSAISEYETAVDLFNSEAKSFNDFLIKIKKYDLIETDTPIDIIHNNINGDPAEANKEKTDAILREIDSIKANTKAIIEKHSQLSKDIISALVAEYNDLADEYNETVKAVVIDYIENIPTEAGKKAADDYDTAPEKALEQIESIIADIGTVASNNQIISRIKAPNIEWVIGCLRKCESISDAQRVTPDNDPNGLLGKEGGYIGCEYFAVRSLAPKSITGGQIIEAGTDIGGAIEIYATKEDALNRCDYLSQFDNTYLTSGSYTIVGTMVIRTSYKLSSEDQVNLTNEIITAMMDFDTLE